MEKLLGFLILFSVTLSCHFQIAQVLNLSLQENPMHVKDAQINKFVPLPLKDLTQVSSSLICSFMTIIFLMCYAFLN